MIVHNNYCLNCLFCIQLCKDVIYRIDTFYLFPKYTQNIGLLVRKYKKIYSEEARLQ